MLHTKLTIQNVFKEKSLINATLLPMPHTINLHARLIKFQVYVQALKSLTVLN